MAAVITKPVKVIKRGDRNRVLALPPYGEVPTAARQQREMVSIVMSWIRAKKTAKTTPSDLFRFETADSFASRLKTDGWDYSRNY